MKRARAESRLASVEGDGRAARIRRRAARWEARRTWAGRALIAISFPLAYLLFMFANGDSPPHGLVRFVVWLWVAAVGAGIICAEAAWRNRFRLEHLRSDEPSG